MKKPESALKNSLLPEKKTLPNVEKDFQIAAERVETVYPATVKKFQKETTKLTFEVPTELSKKIKIRGIHKGVTISRLITEILEREFLE